MLLHLLVPLNLNLCGAETRPVILSLRYACHEYCQLASHRNQADDRGQVVIRRKKGAGSLPRGKDKDGRADHREWVRARALPRFLLEGRMKRRQWPWLWAWRGRTCGRQTRLEDRGR